MIWSTSNWTSLNKKDENQFDDFQCKAKQAAVPTAAWTECRGKKQNFL